MIDLGIRHIPKRELKRISNRQKSRAIRTQHCNGNIDSKDWKSYEQLFLLFLKERASHVVVWLCVELCYMRVKLVNIEVEHGKQSSVMLVIKSDEGCAII